MKVAPKQNAARTLDHTSRAAYLAAMATLQCRRCGQTREGMAFQPFPTDLGRKVHEQICGVCWAEWTKTQQQLINHYGLNVRDPKAREFLLQNMEQFLFQTPSEV